MSKFVFSDSDKDKIKEAVAALERQTAGELVIYFARKSDSYLGAAWKFAALMGLLVALLVGIMSYMWMLPEWFTPLFYSIMMVVVMLVAYLVVVLVPPMRLQLTSSATIDQRVLTRARDIFLQEEVFNTHDRIGILFYISELEHQVVVLGDTGINAKIKEKDWKHIVETIILGIKHGQVAQGIINAISICQDLLLEHGFTNVEKDDNELSDDIRIEE